MAKRTIYTVTVSDANGRPTMQIDLGDPKSARIVATKYQKDGQTAKVTKSER
ncbi:MAG TPA: hypothetical protein VL738_40180 [Dactylosporangium sp.]|jgi:hypothetical protein|nr:hypothetical protein [Dactylosporangium sp.]